MRHHYVAYLNIIDNTAKEGNNKMNEHNIIDIDDYQWLIHKGTTELKAMAYRTQNG